MGEKADKSTGGAGDCQKAGKSAVGDEVGEGCEEKGGVNDEIRTDVVSNVGKVVRVIDEPGATGGGQGEKEGEEKGGAVKGLGGEEKCGAPAGDDQFVVASCEKLGGKGSEEEGRVSKGGQYEKEEMTSEKEIVKVGEEKGCASGGEVSATGAFPAPLPSPVDNPPARPVGPIPSAPYLPPVGPTPSAPYLRPVGPTQSAQHLPPVGPTPADKLSAVGGGTGVCGPLDSVTVVNAELGKIDQKSADAATKLGLSATNQRALDSQLQNHQSSVVRVVPSHVPQLLACVNCTISCQVLFFFALCYGDHGRAKLPQMLPRP